LAPIRLLIADDHQIVLEALASHFAQLAEFSVVAGVADGNAAIAAAARHQPDVALLDLFMPPAGGTAAAEKLHALLPGCGIVLMTAIPRPGLLARALDLGVLGAVAKTAPLSSLVAVLRAAAAGKQSVDPEIDAALGRLRECPLSAREAEVLRHAVTGMSIAEIAKHSCLAEGTVRNLVSSAIKKLNARNRYDAARIAMAEGLL
jgi:two-component system response regulator DesR